MKRLFPALICFLAIAFIVACPGSDNNSSKNDDNGGTGNQTADVSETIDSSGGIVIHPDGVYVEVPEGAVDEDEIFSITALDNLPKELPNDIEANINVYKINFSGDKLNTPAIISLPLSDDNFFSDEGSLGIYKWDGANWFYAGGEVWFDEIITYASEFSVFVVGSGRSLHKKFAFQNSIGWDATVYVASYQLAHPDLDAPLTGAFGVPVRVPPNNYPEALGFYPQGWYRFCAEFWINPEDHPADDVGWYYVFVGSDYPLFDYELNENTSLVVPPQVLFDTIDFRYPGRCPAIRNVGAGPGNGGGGGGGTVVITGTWQFNLRCAGYEEDVAEIVITLNESGGEFFGSAAGEDYTGVSMQIEIQGGYYKDKNIISGTIRTKSEEGVERLDTYSTQLTENTNYFKLTLEECKPPDSCCTGEAKLTKLY